MNVNIFVHWMCEDEKGLANISLKFSISFEIFEGLIQDQSDD